MAIRKGNKHQLGLFFLFEACQRNAAGWFTAVWPANAKLPLPHRRSSITRPCCGSQAPSSLSLHACTSKFERSTGSESERVDALGLRAVEVIICMITRDFSVISMTSQASLSLSLSLSLSQKSLTHNIGSASALPIIRARTSLQDYFYAGITCTRWPSKQRSSGITTTRAWKSAGLLPRGDYFYAVTPAETSVPETGDINKGW